MYTVIENVLGICPIARESVLPIHDDTPVIFRSEVELTYFELTHGRSLENNHLTLSDLQEKLARLTTQERLAYERYFEELQKGRDEAWNQQ